MRHAGDVVRGGSLLALTAAIVLGLLAPAAASQVVASASRRDDEGGLRYPPARRVEASDLLHGLEVADPYRWLEDLDAAETREWVRAQHELTVEVLENHPRFEEMRRRLVELQSLDRYSSVAVRDSRLFYQRTRGGSRRPALLVQDGPDGEPWVVIDADETWGDPRDRVAWTFTPSRKGDHVVYGIYDGASNWRRLRIRDVASGRDLPEVLEGVWNTGSISWAPDGCGFLYSAFDPPAEDREGEVALRNQELRFHRLGTPQSDDVVVHRRADRPKWTFVGDFTRNGKRIVVLESRGETVDVMVAEILGDGDLGTLRFRTVLADADPTTGYVGSDGPLLWILTQKGAPKGRLVEIDAADSGAAGPRDLIAESDATLGWVTVAGDRFLAIRVEDAVRTIGLYDRSGQFVRDVEVPGEGAASPAGWPGSSDAYLRVSGFADPGSVYAVDLKSGSLSLVRRPELTFSPDDFVTRHVFYRSADGTRVPMFVAHRRGLVKNGDHRVFQYGYGAWGWSAFPWFQPHVLMWLELGGVYALPGIRGGGEYGEAWHRAGIRENKQNSIDDFIAAAEWLVEEEYTSAGGIAANGGSASGLLAAAAIVQRPDLFGAAIIDHPALDLIRAERFQGGHLRVPEYGTVEDPDQFRVLFELSPYHNLEPGSCYPPVLVTLGEDDQTTVPSHGYKFIAALQHAQRTASGCREPALLQMVWQGGHYVFGNTPEEAASTWARQLALLLRETKPGR